MNFVPPHGDTDLIRAFSKLMARMQASGGMNENRIHGLMCQIGIASAGAIPVNSVALIPIVKPCQIMEWTLDGNLSGSVALNVEYAPWAIPRVFAAISSSGLPSISGAATAGSADMTGWTQKLDRKGLVRVTVTSATTIELIAFVLYVRDVSRQGLTTP